MPDFRTQFAASGTVDVATLGFSGGFAVVMTLDNALG
jgi:hypothetical protein